MSTTAEYRLPFDTKNPLRISQGRNGPWSHQLIEGKDYANAVDFALPLGSAVLASRPGRMVMFDDTSDTYYEGLDPAIGNSLKMRGAANFVFIQHEDGLTVAIYSHLAKGSVVRQTTVNTGDVIAYTGKSGWIAEIPHLHFEVINNNTPRRSHLVTFTDYEGSLDHETLAREGKIWFGK
jgi:murein DD-endopeptidase MepM/ murein hydrolase activator NlpD